MAMGQAELQILLKAKDETQRALRGSRKGFADLARAAKAGFAIAGVAAVGAGVAALKMAADFEKGMAEVATLAPNMSEETFGVLRQGVLDLSKEMGITTKEVVPALYQAISAGVPAENVLTFMKLASKAAVGGVTDLETAVDGITSVVNAYGKGVIRAQEAADIMFTGVRLGKTDFTQLSAALFNVIPTAATLGISMAEVTAALATITAQGVPTSIATTSLRAAFVEASKGGTLLDKAIREMTGKGFQGLIAGGSTAAGIFDALRSETEASGESFNDLFGSVEAMGAVLQITGPNAAKMNEALAEMGASAGAVDTAFATVSDTTSFKFGKAMNQMKVTLTEVGLKILPAATVALGWFQDAFKAVSKWIDQNREMIRETFTRIGEVVQRLWGHFRSGLEVIWPVIRSFFRFLIDNKPILIGVLAAIGVAIVMALGPVSGAVLAITGMIMVIGFLRDNWDMIKEKAGVVWHAIGEAVESAVNFIIDVLIFLIRSTSKALSLWLTPWRKILEVIGKFIPAAGELAAKLKVVIPEIEKVNIELDTFAVEAADAEKVLREDLNPELDTFAGAAADVEKVLREDLNPTLETDTPRAFAETETAARNASTAINSVNVSARAAMFELNRSVIPLVNTRHQIDDLNTPLGRLDLLIRELADRALPDWSEVVKVLSQDDLPTLGTALGNITDQVQAAIDAENRYLAALRKSREGHDDVTKSVFEVRQATALYSALLRDIGEPAALAFAAGTLTEARAIEWLIAVLQRARGQVDDVTKSVFEARQETALYSALLRDIGEPAALAFAAGTLTEARAIEWLTHVLQKARGQVDDVTESVENARRGMALYGSLLRHVGEAMAEAFAAGTLSEARALDVLSAALDKANGVLKTHAERINEIIVANQKALGSSAVTSGFVAPVLPDRETLLKAAALQGVSPEIIVIMDEGLKVAGLGKGGIAMSPTLALIGEAGPEAVVPLNRAGGIGPTIHVHMEGAQIYGFDDFDRQVRKAVRDGVLEGGFHGLPGFAGA